LLIIDNKKEANKHKLISIAMNKIPSFPRSHFVFSAVMLTKIYLPRTKRSNWPQSAWKSVKVNTDDFWDHIVSEKPLRTSASSLHRW